jgi:hypothetical protein
MIRKSTSVIAVGFATLALAVVGLLAWGRSRSAPLNGTTEQETRATTGQNEVSSGPIPSIDAAAPETETATFAMG